ncbi:CoA ester lyase [Bradyrhizobium prioriisuperbiae]|uniref:HpcH/HpaI aldolase/citrate lyase family protein n=1 Tax=Bradyrhizobium prioriisuperbiae TaxID=2854389 RepID=UPI0028EF556B|nr:CoA ester lyase [Bradyrhizobium prioritasuperba]
MSEQDFVRRSQLVTPAASEKMIVKALAVDCDSVVIDLEDAIAPGRKAEGRQVLRNALSGANAGTRELGVRINGLETPWCLDDLLALEGLPIDTIVVPKVNCAEDVYAYDQLVRQIEFRLKKRLTLQLLIETARGLENAYAIARASPRIRCLIFGVGDFMADTGMAFDAALLMPVRSRVVTAASAAGVQAIDHVHPAVADIEGLNRAAREAHALGFAGKWAIHPQQVGPINMAFSPSPEEIEKARRIVDVYETAQRAGQGAISLDGALVDEAVLKIARRSLAIARSNS